MKNKYIIVDIVERLNVSAIRKVLSQEYGRSAACARHCGITQQHLGALLRMKSYRAKNAMAKKILEFMEQEGL